MNYACFILISVQLILVIFLLSFSDYSISVFGLHLIVPNFTCWDDVREEYGRNSFGRSWNSV